MLYEVITNPQHDPEFELLQVPENGLDGVSEKIPRQGDDHRPDQRPQKVQGDENPRRRITSYNVCYTKLLRWKPGNTVLT